MKSLELTENVATRGEKQANQQPLILMLGGKPVAMLLHTAETIAHLAEFEQVVDNEESVTLTIGGKPIAILQPLVPLVLVGDEDVDLESVILSVHPQFLELIVQSRRRQKTTGGLSSADMRRRLEVA
jgi:hypothetical protein